MPARLPDEDLAPVEGAAPPDTVVAPTEFGLNSAAEALNHAASVGFRANIIQQRAQSDEDKRAVTPLLTDVQGAMQGSLINATSGYHGEPGFVPKVQQGGQEVANSFADRRASLTPGQQAQFDRGVQGLLVDHQAAGLRIQNEHQATVIDQGNKAQDQADLNTALVPTLTQMQALDKNLAVTHAGDPGAIAAYRSGAQGVAAANWGAFANSSGLSQAQLASLKPQYDMKVAEETLQGAGRLGDQQATYSNTHLVSTVAPTLDAAVGAIATDATLYGPAMQPGGTIEQAAKPLGTGEAADKALAEAKTTATVNYVGALIRTKQYDLAQSELDSGRLDPYLHGDTKLSLENELARHGPAAASEAAAAYTDAQTGQLDVAMRASEGTRVVTPQQQARMSQEMSPDAYAKWQVDGHNADLVYQQIGGPISKQPLAALQAIRPPTPADAAADPSMYQAKAAAYQAAQAQITQRLKDPAAWAMGQDRGQGVKGGGKPGAPGDRWATGCRPTSTARTARAALRPPARSTSRPGPPTRPRCCSRRPAPGSTRPARTCGCSPRGWRPTRRARSRRPSRTTSSTPAWRCATSCRASRRRSAWGTA